MLLNKFNLLYPIAIILLLLFAYLPTLQFDFAPGDQWRAFQYSLLDEPFLLKAVKCYHERILFDIRTGRPLCSIGECLEHALVGEICDFSKLRPVALLVTMFTVFCVGGALSFSLGSYNNGSAVGALFLFSPGYAFMLYRGLATVMISVALVIASFSYVLTRRAFTRNYSKVRLCAAAFLFLLACMIYPAWAFVVYIYALIDFLFDFSSAWRVEFRRLITRTIFFIIISLLYYGIIKSIISFIPYADTGTDYEFSANFHPAYLLNRFLKAIDFFIQQPPLNTLSGSYLIAIILILWFCYWAWRSDSYSYKVIHIITSIFLSILIIFISITPWLASNMSYTGNRYFIAFSLFVCATVGWTISDITCKLFPTKKYFAPMVLLFFVLMPASAIQNKRSFYEVRTSNIEIKFMRSALDNWIDKRSYTHKRLIVVVKPKYPRPFFYDIILRAKNCGDSFSFSGDPSYYFQMFSAILREKCSPAHPLIQKMTIYDGTLQPNKKTERLLDENPNYIVFTVKNQGEPIVSKHEILDINFSFLTIFPEPLLVIRQK